MNYFVNRKNNNLILDEKKYTNNIFFIKNDIIRINLSLLGGSNNLPVFNTTPTAIGTEDTNYVYNISITDVDSSDTVVISAPVFPSPSGCPSTYRFFENPKKYKSSLSQEKK